MSIKIMDWLWGPIVSFIGRLTDRFKSKSEKIDIAINQGYEICRAHYPPAVMTTVDEVNWECQKCGNKRYTGLAFGRLYHWR